MSKKSGLPDMDLPPLNETSNLKKLNCFNFSVIVEESHYIVMPKFKYTNAENPSDRSLVSTKKKDKLNQSSNSNKSNGVERKKFKSEKTLEFGHTEPLMGNEVRTVKKKNCCFCCLKIFK
jgi:hypothetical protein